MNHALTPALDAFFAGHPIAPIGFLPNGRPVFPIAGGAEDDPPKGDPPKQDEPPKDDYKPPATQADLDRIVTDRLSRERAKYGNLTPEELAELRNKAQRQDALEDELASATEKAVKEARVAALGEADARYQPAMVQAAFEIAIGGRKAPEEVAEFLGDLNLKSFISEDGKVNTAKVLTRAEQFAPTKPTEQQRGPSMPRPGSTSVPSPSVANGRDLWEERHGKKKTA